MNDKICTFFGHRDCSESIIPELYKKIEELIVNEKYRVFYIGNHGNYDRYVSNVLALLKNEYKIKVYIVLAYLPTNENNNFKHETILPDGIETVPKKFAIIYRNKWMVDRSDTVLTYVQNNFGGAAQFKEYAIKKKKKVIELLK